MSQKIARILRLTATPTTSQSARELTFVHAFDNPIWFGTKRERIRRSTRGKTVHGRPTAARFPGFAARNRARTAPKETRPGAFSRRRPGKRGPSRAADGPDVSPAQTPGGRRPSPRARTGYLTVWHDMTTKPSRPVARLRQRTKHGDHACPSRQSRPRQHIRPAPRSFPQ